MIVIGIAVSSAVGIVVVGLVIVGIVVGIACLTAGIAIDFSAGMSSVLPSVPSLVMSLSVLSFFLPL